MIDYNVYVCNKKEILKYILKWIGIACIIAYVYFNNWISLILMLGMFPLYIKSCKKKIIVNRKKRLKEEFNVMLESLCVALESGNSVEKAFLVVEEEIRCVYGDNSNILTELIYLNNNVKMGRNIEEGLIEFAKRSGIDEIIDYADVFSISKRTDGNLIKISEYTSLIIRNGIEINQEIKTSITKRCSEIKIMQIMPFGMMLYLKISSPGFFNNVYDCLLGNCILSILFLLYAIIYYCIEISLSNIEEGMKEE